MPKRQVIMIKNRLKDIDLRITEIAEYLHLSRPTVYKFIDCYDKKQFKMIDDRALKLFNFIEENEFVGKRGAISYILNNLTDATASDGTVDGVIKYLRENPASKKSRFITECTENDTFDSIIYYLADITPLLNKNDLTDSEKELIQPYNELINNIKNKNS